MMLLPKTQWHPCKRHKFGRIQTVWVAGEKRRGRKCQVCGVYRSVTM
jgi:hypothetical protein